MIKLYSPFEIEKIAASGRILAKLFKKLTQEAKVGVSLKFLDKLAEQIIKENNAEPAFLGYRPNGARKPYPASICASINEVIVHGVPNDYCLKDGDVLKIDCGVKYQNFYSDAAITLAIGKTSQETKLLIKTTKEALAQAIKIAKPGNTLGDIGWLINRTAEQAGFKVIKTLTGHGIGAELHEDPTLYNFGKRGNGIKLKPGMVLAIEPMFSAGSDKIIQRQDESWATSDNSLSAHFEHTIAITSFKPQVLTK